MSSPNRASGRDGIPERLGAACPMTLGFSLFSRLYILQLLLLSPPPCQGLSQRQEHSRHLAKAYQIMGGLTPAPAADRHNDRCEAENRCNDGNYGSGAWVSGGFI